MQLARCSSASCTRSPEILGPGRPGMPVQWGEDWAEWWRQVWFCLDDAPRARRGHRVFGNGLHRLGPRLGRPLTNLEGCLL